MPLPGDLTTITITGDYSDILGNNGSVPLPAVKTHRPMIEVSGQASLPASFSVSGATAAPAAYWLAAS